MPPVVLRDRRRRVPAPWRPIAVSVSTEETHVPHLLDLTQEIYEGMYVYPGHLETKIWDHHQHDETAKKFEGGFSYASRGLTLSDHGPTHVDALSHLDPSPGAPSIDQMDLEQFYGEGVCIDVSDAAPRTDITAADLDAALARSEVPLVAGMVLLLHTGTHRRLGGTEEYLSQYPGLDESASAWLVERGVKVFGVDCPSPDNPASRTYPCHMMCRRHGITHYENLAEIHRLLNRRFTFIGFPLRIRGGTGSPVRAVAIVHED
jgi:kynurenine formamidase